MPGFGNAIAIGFRRGGGLVSPDAIPDLARWGNPALLELDDTDPIETYPDQSGNNVVFEQSLAANMPTYSATGINGHPAVRYTAAGANSSWLQADAFANALFGGTNQPFTWAAPIKFADFDTDSQCFFMVAQVVGVNENVTADLFYSAESNCYIFARRDDTPTNDRTYGAGLTNDTTARVLVRVFDGTLDSLYVDGVLVAQFTSGASGAFTPDAFTLGTHRRNNVGPVDIPFDGWMGDDLLYTRALNATEIGQVTAYLRSVYGTPSTTPVEIPQFTRMALTAWNREDGCDTLVNDATVPIWYSRINPVAGDYTGVDNPLYKTNIQNSRAMILLNGTSQYFVNAQLAEALSGTAQAFSLTIAFKLPALPGSQREIFTIYNTGVANPIMICAVAADGTLAVFRRNDAGTILVATSALTIGTDAVVLSYIYNGSNITVYVDGVEFINDTMPGGAATFTDFRIGHGPDGFTNMYVGECVVDSVVWDNTMLLAVEDELITEWGI
jgi:hypothetical protein